MPEEIRLVIWDLDETFWKGTLAEGGISEYVQAHHAVVVTLAAAFAAVTPTEAPATTPSLRLNATRTRRRSSSVGVAALRALANSASRS